MDIADEIIDDRLETIALLQEEVARLEAELESRDAALRAASEAPASGRDEPPAGASPRLAELEAAVAERDEVIVALLDQGRLYEEAADAQRREWEQLTAWVEEVERRVEGRDAAPDDLARALERERRQADELRREWAVERRAWEAERAALGREAEHLRERLEAAHPGAGPQAEALERENRRLRQAVDRLGRDAALAEEVGPLRDRLAGVQAELEQAVAALRREEDERRREAIENEAAIRALQAKLVRFAAGTAEPAPRPEGEDGAGSYREVDERIRAFRQHLRELHEREEAERSARSLGARLSRLWRHTGPS